MRDYLRLMGPTLKVVKERHDDPKNMAKGDYITDVYEAWGKTNEEFAEVSDEMLSLLTYRPSPTEQLEILGRMRYELGDLILCAAMTVSAVETKMKELQDEN